MEETQKVEETKEKVETKKWKQPKNERNCEFEEIWPGKSLKTPQISCLKGVGPLSMKKAKKKD